MKSEEIIAFVPPNKESINILVYVADILLNYEDGPSVLFQVFIQIPKSLKK